MSASDAFFDTNVLLYLLSEEVAKADRVEELLKAGGIISVQVLNEFAAVAVRKLAMRVAEIKEILAIIRAVCSVHPLDVETHELGLKLAERYRYSIYDSMIIASALRAGCLTVFSEDFQHGRKIDRLMIVDPFRGD
ncbi:MAG: PIN domain-containing protein [Candidatus Binataceae bacterium]